MSFDIIGGIDQIEIIATGKSIRDIKLLRKQFGPGRWRKLKGVATGVGRHKFKIKSFLD